MCFSFRTCQAPRVSVGPDIHHMMMGSEGKIKTNLQRLCSFQISIQSIRLLAKEIRNDKCEHGTCHLDFQNFRLHYSILPLCRYVRHCHRGHPADSPASSVSQVRLHSLPRLCQWCGIHARGGQAGMCASGCVIACIRRWVSDWLKYC